jgi:hypothetical protein
MEVGFGAVVGYVDIVTSELEGFVMKRLVDVPYKLKE